MSNFLKYKLTAIVCSLTVLVLIPLFNSSFNAPESWERWKILTWDDFRGVAKPFSKWGATIRSYVFLEYDSLTDQYKAYSAMDQNHSWKSSPRNLSDYLLNHEQYHFNITEYFSRKMNSILSKGNYDEYEVASLLGKIQREKDQLQSQYDEEVDHGLNWGVQRYWEYKIDSLLASFHGCCGKLMDENNINIYLPYTDVEKGEWKDRTFGMDRYWLTKYDMTLSLSIIKSETISNIDDPKEPDDGVEIYNYAWDSLAILSVREDMLPFSKRITAFDSLDQKIIEDLWVKEEGKMYRLAAEYPNRKTAEEGFLRVVNSYFNSFEIVQNDR